MSLELTQDKMLYRLACRRGHFNINRQWRSPIGYVQSFNVSLMIVTNEPLRSEAFGVSNYRLCVPLSDIKFAVVQAPRTYYFKLDSGPNSYC